MEKTKSSGYPKCVQETSGSLQQFQHFILSFDVLGEIERNSLIGYRHIAPANRLQLFCLYKNVFKKVIKVTSAFVYLHRFLLNVEG